MRRPQIASTESPERIPSARIDSARPKIEKFESLVDELSAAMARASVNEIDEEIKKWLQKIVVALEVDRGTLWEPASDGGLVATHWWARPGIPGLPRKMLSTQISPWATAQVFAGKT